MFLLLWLLGFIFFTNTAILNGQTCLRSPKAIRHELATDDIYSNSDDILWTQLSDGVYHTTLVYDAATITWLQQDTGGELELTTRLHNGSLPSPSFRIRRGNQYQVTLINNLGPESANNPTESNVHKDVNTTNIHTHGLHIGGNEPGDHVFVEIHGGESFTYIYNIPCQHAGGLHWYHPHHHGATTMQVGGGSAGAILVEEDASYEALPDWLINMNEIILVIQHINPMFIKQQYNGIDNLFDFTSRRGASEDFYTINGEYQPTICITSGQWTKFRLLNIDYRLPKQINIGDNFGTCELMLLARDGVLVHGFTDTDIPRSVDRIWLTQASRADIAVHCPGSENLYPIYINGTLLGYIDSSGDESSASEELTQFTPNRPAYQKTLLRWSGNFEQYGTSGPTMDIDNSDLTQTQDYWTVRVSTKGINGISFEGKDSYLANVTGGSVNEWVVENEGGVLHPFHMHVNHFQIMALSEETDWMQDGWLEIGDFVDALFGPGIVRWYADTWGGLVVFHCHILKHADEGATATLNIESGCDYDLITPVEGSTVCNYTCDGDSDGEEMTTTAVPSMRPSNGPSDRPTASPVSNPTSGPTRDPTRGPTKRLSSSPFSDPTESPTRKPTRRPTNGPIDDPTNSPTKRPTEASVDESKETETETDSESDDSDSDDSSGYGGGWSKKSRRKERWSRSNKKSSKNSGSGSSKTKRRSRQGRKRKPSY